MIKYLTDISLQNNEIKEVRLEKLPAAPESPKASRIYFDTTLKALRCYTGAAWATLGDCNIQDIKQGPGISVNLDNKIATISHGDTSEQESIAADKNIVISGVTLDDFGHITGLSTQEIPTYSLSADIADNTPSIQLSDDAEYTAVIKLVGENNLEISVLGDQIIFKSNLATDSTAGIVKLATISETQSGTLTDTVVTPAGLKSVTDLLVNNISSNYSTKAETNALETSLSTDIQNVSSNLSNFRTQVETHYATKAEVSMDTNDLSLGISELDNKTDGIIRDLQDEREARESADTSINSRVTQLAENVTNFSSMVESIEDLIPPQASAENQLADKDFVNSSITSISAEYITSNANGDAFPTRASLLAGPYYHQGQLITLSKNDYALVEKDETRNNASVRYVYGGTQWDYQYTLNTTPFTAAQAEAINSGITASAVSQIRKNTQDTVTNKESIAANTAAISSANTSITNITNSISSIDQDITTLENDLNELDVKITDIIATKVKKVVGVIQGNASATIFKVTHNLNTLNTVVNVFDNNNQEIIVDITRDTVNTITITFGAAPLSTELFTVVVIG